MPLGLLFHPELKAHRGAVRPRGASSVSPLLPLHMAPLTPLHPSPPYPPRAPDSGKEFSFRSCPWVPGWGSQSDVLVKD